MKKIIYNIPSLHRCLPGASGAKRGSEMKDTNDLKNAYLIVENEHISAIGSMDDLKEELNTFDEVIDASERLVLPAFCDSHTHVVFAEPRHGEFVDRIKGMTYEEIALRGGGILNSAKKLADKSEDELFDDAWKRLEEVRAYGTGAIEIKSGYGLNKEAEIKMLRVIKRLKEKSPLMIKSTFLGAHALPPEYKENRTAYIDLVINEMLPQIAEEGLADYIDAFCETGYFTPEDTERIIQAGKKYGIPAKIHVNQFTSIGGVKVCVDNDALSVDHLEVMNDEDFDLLKGSSTLPVALPSCSFFLSIPYTPARKIIDNDMPLVLATDYNPGSTPSGNMQFVMSLGSIKMNLLPEETLNASTINGAYAMELENEVGSLEVGKRANIIITKKMDSLNFIPYNFSYQNIEKVWINGEDSSNF